MTMNEKSRAKSGADPAGTMAGLLYHAYVIEAEAETRYLELAAQMETHNNAEVAALFRKLAAYEGEHAAHVGAIRPALPRPPLDPWDFSWMGHEAPESIAHQSVRYDLTPREALELSREAEKAAEAFFRNLAERSEDAEITELARTFAEEEKMHVRLIEKALKKYPAEKDRTMDDWDEPVGQG